MFQDYALFPHLTVQGNTEFGLRMNGMKAAARAARVKEVLTTVGLVDYADRPIHELSGGEQQRVALARTLAPSPRLILLDEPIGSLDRTLREHLITEMRSIFSELGVTAIYVTHDRDEAFAVADTVAVMNHGRLVRKGTPQELWSNPQDEFVARMLGFNTIVDAKVVDGWADLGWALVGSDLPSGEHRLVIPPHSIRVARDGTIEGRVLNSTYRAGSYHTEIAIGDSVVSTTTGDRYAPEDAIRFHIAPSDLMALHP
jgi:thiamine transport system ATP-binding protein